MLDILVIVKKKMFTSSMVKLYNVVLLMVLKLTSPFEFAANYGLSSFIFKSVACEPTWLFSVPVDI